MTMCEVVAAMLRSAGLTDVYSVPVSAGLCKEPITVELGEYERTDEVTHGERGVLGVRVVCVRNVFNEAKAKALQCRTILRSMDWERWASAGDLRIYGIEVDYPSVKGRDGSGRWLVELPVELTVAADDE